MCIPSNVGICISSYTPTVENSFTPHFGTVFLAEVAWDLMLEAEFCAFTLKAATMPIIADNSTNVRTTLKRFATIAIEEDSGFDYQYSGDS